MSRTLCLDLGTKTGWCLIEENGSFMHHGMSSFENTRMEGGGMRFLRFNRWLESMVRDYRVGALFFEEVRGHTGTTAAQVYGGFLAVLTAQMEACKVPYLGVHTGTIKKHLTGKGNAGKPAMVAGVLALTGISAKDDNEADAIALAWYVLATELTSATGRVAAFSHIGGATGAVTT